MDSENVMSWLEGLAEPYWRDFHSDSEVQNIAKSALELLKSQRETIDELISADKLLKEQEAKQVNISQTHCGMKYGLCPRCGKQIDTLVNPHYCGNCGQELKWK